MVQYCILSDTLGATEKVMTYFGGYATHPSKPTDPKFAVFPDYETGRKAQATRLKEGNLYIDLTLAQKPIFESRAV
jgi:hypothetical protein